MCGCIRESKPSGVKTDAVLEDEGKGKQDSNEHRRQ
jgi:hypothetical protein